MCTLTQVWPPSLQQLARACSATIWCASSLHASQKRTGPGTWRCRALHLCVCILCEGVPQCSARVYGFFPRGCTGGCQHRRAPACGSGHLPWPAASGLPAFKRAPYLTLTPCVPHSPSNPCSCAHLRVLRRLHACPCVDALSLCLCQWTHLIRIASPHQLIPDTPLCSCVIFGPFADAQSAAPAAGQCRRPGRGWGAPLR